MPVSSFASRARTNSSSRGFSRRLRKGRSDYLSRLPFELFLLILSYVLDAASPRTIPTLKRLSRVNKNLRVACIAAGLFTNVSLTMRQGYCVVIDFFRFLGFNKDVALSIKSLTIDSRLLLSTNASSSPVANILRRLSELTTLRITGTDRSELVKGGNFALEDGAFFKILTSGGHLRNLRRLEIHNLRVTRILIDIIAALPSYVDLDLSDSVIQDGLSIRHLSRDSWKPKVTKFSLSYSERRPGSNMENLFRWLRLSNIGRNIAYLSLGTDQTFQKLLTSAFDVHDHTIHGLRTDQLGIHHVGVQQLLRYFSDTFAHAFPRLVTICCSTYTCGSIGDPFSTILFEKVPVRNFIWHFKRKRTMLCPNVYPNFAYKVRFLFFVADRRAM
jgi:hypothetical protein